MLVVDARGWLDKHGQPRLHDPKIRRRLLRVARLIEYGGPLKPGAFRETLVECVRRPANRKACLGLLWVAKTDENDILAYCPGCETDQVLIQGWRSTPWAEGPMEPASPRVLDQEETPAPPPPAES